MNKTFWKAALNRALRTVAQTLVGSVPTGFIVTANMIKSLDINVLWAILAWLATGLLAGGISILMSVATGLPEVETVVPHSETRTIYLDEFGHEISEDEVEAMCKIKVPAYNDYYDDGSPKVVKTDEPHAD